MLKQPHLFKTVVFSFMLLATLTLSAGNKKTPPTNFDFQIMLQLPDTINVSAIVVTLGNTTGSSNLLTHSFTYDQKTGLPSGLVYKRERKEVQLTLGSFPIGVAMYGQYIIKDNNGNTVLTKQFSYR